MGVDSVCHLLCVRPWRPVWQQCSVRHEVQGPQGVCGASDACSSPAGLWVPLPCPPALLTLPALIPGPRSEPWLQQSPAVNLAKPPAGLAERAGEEVTKVRRENAVSDVAEPGSRVRKKESHQLGACGRACVSVKPFGSCRKVSSFLCCEQDRPEREASGEVTALSSQMRRICL